MNTVPDQIPIWNKKHKANDHASLKEIESPFADVALEYFKTHSHILELGCGVGRDSFFFAKNGHTVVATDGSNVVIGQNIAHEGSKTVCFDVLDMRSRYPYEDESFDVVYGNLCLHYYDDETTKKIVLESLRVLKPSGVLAFSCKSHDSLHVGGEEISPDVFASPSGQVIHLFTQEYMKTLFSQFANVQYLDEVEEEFNGRTSKVVRCISEK